MNEERATFLDGSITDSIKMMNEWKHKRFGITSPKSISYKITHSWQIVQRNRNAFLLLLLIYFIAEVIGNSVILVVLWYFDKKPTHEPHSILIQLTANWPVRLWRSCLTACLIFLVMSSVKRKGHELILTDIKNIRGILSFKFFICILITDIFLVTPMNVSQALLSSDILWASIYFIFGFLLNWIFGFAQLLIFEDPSLPLYLCFIWSAASAFSLASFKSILITTVLVLLGTPFIVFTPILLVLQLLTFYEVFGFSSPDEIQYSVPM